MLKTKCKRCGQSPTWSDPFHRGFGAKSLTDDKSRICSDCGVEESLERFLDGEPTPKSEWPIVR